jgi:hypothetical protein
MPSVFCFECNYIPVVLKCNKNNCDWGAQCLDVAMNSRHVGLLKLLVETAGPSVIELTAPVSRCVRVYDIGVCFYKFLFSAD